MPISESDLSRTSSVQYRANTQPGPGRRAIANTQTAVQKLDTALNPFVRPHAQIPPFPVKSPILLSNARHKALIKSGFEWSEIGGCWVPSHPYDPSRGPE